MNLDGEVLMRVDKFHQERELVARPECRPEQLFASRADQIADRRAGQAPLLDDAHLVAMVGDLPALGIIERVADRLVQHRTQTPASPDQAGRIGSNFKG